MTSEEILHSLGFHSAEHVRAACYWQRDFVAVELSEILMRRIRESFTDDNTNLEWMIKILPEQARDKARKYADAYKRTLI